MNPYNWKITAPIRLDPSWTQSEFPSGIIGPGYLEGNAVVGPDGILRNVLRFDATDNKTLSKIMNRAIILKLNETSNTLMFEKFIKMPGGHTKFVIRYDEIT